MNDFKTMIAEALAAGEDITSIVNSFTKAANEAEKEFEDQQAKAYAEDLAARPWAYGLREMGRYADKILDGTLTKQDAMELFVAIALKDAPAPLRDHMTRSDIMSFVKTVDSAFNHFAKMTSLINNINISDTDKVAGLIQETFSMFPELKVTTKPKKILNPDEMVISEFIKNL